MAWQGAPTLAAPGRRDELGGSFPQGFIETVRNAGDIVRLIADYVPLKQAGRRLKGLCPFHQEKTPSFSVDPEAQLFYCFGCQTGGDAFKFVMLYEKVAFPESIEMLARRWGVALPAGASRGADDPAARMRELNDAAQRFYRSVLLDPAAGRRCRDYLERRGIDDETSAALGLGCAPEGWDALRSHLAAERFPPQELLRAGLVLPRKTGGEYDRFRDRLVFPIRDIRGRTVAFGGRALGADEPKYINSPETPAYKKGEHLYGLDRAREAIRREGYAIVVEGYLDLAALVQAGFAHVVASLGTAFTAEQAKLLARVTDRVVFSYDGDAAGAAATERSLGLLLEQSFAVRVVELPGGLDPDDFIKRESAEAYGKRLQEAPEYIEYLIRREVRSRDLASSREQVEAVNALLPHIARLATSIDRLGWADRLSDALGIDDGLVTQELRAAARRAGSSIRRRPPGAQTALLSAEARLVHCLLRSPGERRELLERLDPADLDGTAVEPLVRAILDLEHEAAVVDAATVLGRLEGAELQDLFARLAFRDEPEAGPSAADCLWALRRERLAREERRMVRRIGELQRGEPGSDDVDRQLTRLQELARQRNALT